MKKKSTKTISNPSASRTDWKRLNAMKDRDIDMSDIPLLTDEFWKNARTVMPRKKKSIALRVDEDVLAWFKNQGKGYQSRMRAVLRFYMQSQHR